MRDLRRFRERLELARELRAAYSAGKTGKVADMPVPAVEGGAADDHGLNPQALLG